MVPEATLDDLGSGLQPSSEGWFVVNVRDAQWLTSEDGEKQPSGSECAFESREHWFRQYGIRLHVLPPGQSNGMYHAETAQEDFLVLSGECTLLVEGEERRLGQWDFFHSPPETEHIFVGAGDGPCVLLMAGARSEDEQIRYPVSELAARYGASVADGDVGARRGIRRLRAVAARATVVLEPASLGVALRPRRAEP